MKKIKIIQLVSSKYKDFTEKEIYSMILCGEVIVDGECIRDPKRYFNYNSEIEIKKKEFVSRGGEKLSFALKKWHLNVANKVFIDAGCSTGGFTDCLLKNGASHIYAVDVGKNQLAYLLRSNNKVSVMEATNIMSINNFNICPDAAVIDLSFRSVIEVASHLLSIVKEKWLIALIKPQFEWKNPDTKFKGIVEDKKTLYRIVRNVINSLDRENVYIKNILLSPIKGRKGNNEFLFFLAANKYKEKEEILIDLLTLIERITI